MWKNIDVKYTIVSAALLGCTLASAANIPGIPRDSNTGNTSSYDATRIEAKIVVPLKENAEAIHFIRDNNDPRR